MPHFGRHPGGPSARPPKAGGRDYNTIQRPDLMLRIQQFFGIRQQNVSPTLSPTVQPVALVADLTQPHGDRKVANEPTTVLLCSGVQTRGPTAAQFSKAQLRNPAGSGVIVKVRYVLFGIQGDLFAFGYIMRNAVDLASVGGALGVDTTFAPPGSALNLIAPKAILSGETSAAPSASQIFAIVNQSTVGSIDIQGPVGPICVLAPGDSFNIDGAIVNTQLIANIGWVEVPLVS